MKKKLHKCPSAILQHPKTSVFGNEEISKRKLESIEASKKSFKAESMDQTEYISEIEDFEDSGSDLK